MFDTNNLSIVVDNEVWCIRKFTRRCIKPTKQLQKKAEIVFLIVRHFANLL
jgi:hypothetical protein